MKDQIGFPIFSFLRTVDFPSQKITDQLHSVTNSQNGNAHLEEGRVASGGIFFIDTGRSSRKDDPLRRQGFHSFYRNIVRMNFTINLAFPYPSGNELGILRPKIENEYLIEVSSRNTFHLIFQKIFSVS